MDWVALGFLLVPPVFVITIFAIVIMSTDQSDTSRRERLPEPTQQQVGLALEVARKALRGERWQIYGDDGRLKVRPVDLGEIEEA